MQINLHFGSRTLSTSHYTGLYYNPYVKRILFGFVQYMGRCYRKQVDIRFRQSIHFSDSVQADSEARPDAHTPILLVNRNMIVRRSS